MTTHIRKVVGSDPGAVYWMDIFHIHLFLKLYCLFEKTENKRKRGRGWPIKKTFTVVIVRHTRGFIRLATTSSVNASFYFSCASFSY